MEDFPKRIELQEGNWVDLKDPYAVSERERRPLKRTFLAIGQAGQAKEAPGDVAVETPVAPMIGGGEVAPAVMAGVDLEARAEAMEQFESEVMAFFITGWSFPWEVSDDTIVDLPAYVYDAIQEAVAPRLEVLFPQLAQKKEEGEPDPTDTP